MSVCLSVLRGSLDHRGLVSDASIGFPVREEQHRLHKRSIGTGDSGRGRGRWEELSEGGGVDGEELSEGGGALRKGEG